MYTLIKNTIEPPSTPWYFHVIQSIVVYDKHWNSNKLIIVKEVTCLMLWPNVLLGSGMWVTLQENKGRVIEVLVTQ